MKNLVLILIFIFPLIVTAIFITRIIKFDSKLELVKEKPVLHGKLKKKLTIDKHASKRRVYFYSDNADKQRYERNYRGFVTNWYVLGSLEQFENSNTLTFYKEINQNKSDEKISFFSLNNVNKNFSYYFDIFQFMKEKYFIALLVMFIVYIFGAGWLIDYYGGITQSKTVGFIFFIDIIYLLLLVFG